MRWLLRRRRLWVTGLVAALAVGVFLGRRQIAWWGVEYAIYRVTAGLPRCDRAEVYLLGIRDHNAPNDPKEHYPTATHWDGGSAILESKRLNGAPAKKLAAIWREQALSYEEQGMCHEPVYGLRFFAGEKLKFEGTLCFHCHNFYTELFSRFGLYWGFDVDSPAGKDLWRELDAAVPYVLRKPQEDALREEKKRRSEESEQREAREAEQAAVASQTSGQNP